MGDRVGQHLGNYRLVRLLDSGGYAEVYLGQHLRLTQQAAIKVLHAHLTQTETEHFQREAETISMLAHPSIIRVFDYDVQDGVPFLVMDYAPNGSLRKLHPKGSQVPLPLIVAYVKQVAGALQYAHEQKVVHRDVKPENMLVGRREEVLLSDFGIATIAHSSGSLSMKEAVGTLAYMAPEQIAGHPREASDQYALGCVVYEWLCGSRPFEGAPTELLAQHLSVSPPPLHTKTASVAPEVERVVLRTLAKDAKERFASVGDFATALEQASLHPPSSHVPLAHEQAPPGESSEPNYTTVDMSLSQAVVHKEAISSPPSNADAVGMVPSPQMSGGQLISDPTAQPVERLWNVPFARNPFFTGRGPLLERLHERLSHGERTALRQPVALSGLGGIGKTQTATEYAYRYRESYRAVFWVRASSRETLVADYMSIAHLLGLPGQDAPDQMQIVAATKHWLEQQESWLLVLDNADELQLLADFLPSGGKGHLLLTTRAQATGKIAETLPVEKMEPSEGMQLLLRRAKLLAPEEPLDNVSTAVRTAAQQLVEELDGLPLALDQAGAYIEETGCNLSEYLALFQHRRLALLQQQSSISADYPRTVASAWALSFHNVEQQDAAAADLLRLCAYLHPDAIPEEILTEGAAELGPVLSPVAADPLLLNRAIQVLRRYSLLKRDPDARLLNLHRLVQVVLKGSLDGPSQRAWAERSVRAVNRAFPEVEYAPWDWDRERGERCLPHALLGAQWIEHYGFTFPEAARLLHMTGFYLYRGDQWRQAKPLLERALSLREQVLGAEHPETARTLNTLAYLYLDLGEYVQAERLVQPALTRFERVLGPEHPVIAITLNILAAASMYEGKYAQAEPLLQRALVLGEQTLGANHPDVANILNTLANTYHYQGKYAQAEPLYERTLAIFEHVLGSEHSYLELPLHNLAILYSDQGKYALAEPLLQRALTIAEQMLGPENPNTAGDLLALGRLSTQQGKYTQAHSLLQRALALHERLLGPESYFTIRNLLSLAQLAQMNGQEAQAESLYQQALARFERVLGPEHPRVAETLTGLAQLYAHQAHYTQAEPLLERALSIAEQALGTAHPQTAAILDAQGQLALQQGREEQAERLLQQALVIQEQALGTAHPEVAQTLQHLAQLYEKQGKYERAEPLCQRALLIRERTLGTEHPETVSVERHCHELLLRMQEKNPPGTDE